MIPSDKAPSTGARAQYLINLSLAGVAGQVGCVTVLIVFGALLAGMWLDGWLKTKPLFTVGLLLGSVPVTLVIMVWLVRSAVARIKTLGPAPKPRKEEESGD